MKYVFALGKTAHYDYDEYYRGHYGNTGKTRRAPSYGTSSTIDNEELNRYWRAKEASGSDGEDMIKIRNKFLLRIVLVLLGNLLLYTVFYKMKRYEEEMQRRNYLKRLKDD